MRTVNKNTPKACIKKANDSQYELVEKLTYSMEGAVTRRVEPPGGLFELPKYKNRKW